MTEWRNVLLSIAGELCSQVSFPELAIALHANVAPYFIIFAAGCVDGGVVIWDTETRGVAQRYKPHR